MEPILGWAFSPASAFQIFKILLLDPHFEITALTWNKLVNALPKVISFLWLTQVCTVIVFREHLLEKNQLNSFVTKFRILMVKLVVGRYYFPHYK